MADKFWVIWCPPDPRPPKVRYYREAEAEKVAKEMVQKYSKEFIVLESKNGFQVGPPKKQKYGKLRKDGAKSSKMSAPAPPYWDTYDGWKARGRQVRMGEHARYRPPHGIPIFTIHQTDPIGD